MLKKKGKTEKNDERRGNSISKTPHRHYHRHRRRKSSRTVVGATIGGDEENNNLLLLGEDADGDGYADDESSSDKTVSPTSAAIRSTIDTSLSPDETRSLVAQALKRSKKVLTCFLAPLIAVVVAFKVAGSLFVK